MDIKIRNPQFNQFGTIDCEIEHPAYGWIPFTASPDDVEEHGRAIHAAASKMNPAKYAAPPVTAADVESEAAHRLATLDNGATPAERESWSAQLSEALTVLGDPARSAPLLDAIRKDGETVVELARKIVTKDHDRNIEVARIIGAKRKLLAMDNIPDDYQDDKWWSEGK